MPLLPYRSDLKYLEAIGIYHLCTVYLGHPFIITAIIMNMSMQVISGPEFLYKAVEALETPVTKVIFIMYSQGRCMGDKYIHVFFPEQPVGIKPWF